MLHGIRRRPVADELERLILTYRVVTIAPIRRELLSGIRAHEQYEGLREKLGAFPNLRLHPEDYELAAQFVNRCRGRSVRGSNTDFLICLVAVRRDSSVF
jgi:predicted nucleic acid-binding protein